MPKKSHPELDGQKPQALYTLQLRRPGQALRERLSWSLIGLSTGVGLMLGYIWLDPLERSWPTFFEPAPPAATEDNFQQGAEHAMQAAELTQSAEFREEWVEVAILWQQAIAKMKAVPRASDQYELAQQKVTEYERNLQYAQSNVDTRTAQAPQNKTYWTTGSDRELVIALQGMPTRVMQYEASCQEVLRYGSSTIELRNGYVRQYNNLDGNLRVLADSEVVLSTQGTPDTWTLGSSKDRVLRVQGTPTRTSQYASPRFTTLYYGNSSVQLDHNQVISYTNFDNNLRISTQLLPVHQQQPAPEYWSMGSNRVDVLRAQNTPPVATLRNDTSCEETFQFANSEVSFRQGYVTGYKNDSQNLQMR
ncbi:MAG: hypothetical protein EA342_11470 [Leptolyngbya sp. LCM1.Bin17]|nr:MAG: hypothetical protein EA342_11470 [Leptolyngbya sp. LCM1.Bin17]